MIMWLSQGMCILYVLFDDIESNSSLLPSCLVKKVPVRMQSTLILMRLQLTF